MWAPGALVGPADKEARAAAARERLQQGAGEVGVVINQRHVRNLVPRARVRRRVRGVGRHGLHLAGEAIDARLHLAKARCCLGGAVKRPSSKSTPITPLRRDGRRGGCYKALARVICRHGAVVRWQPSLGLGVGVDGARLVSRSGQSVRRGAFRGAICVSAAPRAAGPHPRRARFGQRRSSRPQRMLEAPPAGRFFAAVTGQLFPSTKRSRGGGPLEDGPEEGLEGSLVLPIGDQVGSQ